MRRPYLPQVYKEQDKLKLEEFEVGGKGVFQAMDSIKTLPLTPLLTAPDMDLILEMRFGNRPVSSKIERIVGPSKEVKQEHIDKVANMLITMFYDKWKGLADIYMEPLELDSYKLITKETIIDDGKTKVDVNQTTNDIVKSEVSGYNSDVMVDNTQDTTDTTDVTSNLGKQDNVRTRETDARGSIGNRLDDRVKALEIAKSTLSELVLKDVTQTITLLSL